MKKLSKAKRRQGEALIPRLEALINRMTAGPARTEVEKMLSELRARLS
jgi:hypothetical protein